MEALTPSSGHFMPARPQRSYRNKVVVLLRTGVCVCVCVCHTWELFRGYGRFDPDDIASSKCKLIFLSHAGARALIMPKRCQKPMIAAFGDLLFDIYLLLGVDVGLKTLCALLMICALVVKHDAWQGHIDHGHRTLCAEYILGPAKVLCLDRRHLQLIRSPRVGVAWTQAWRLANAKTAAAAVRPALHLRLTLADVRKQVSFTLTVPKYVLVTYIYVYIHIQTYIYTCFLYIHRYVYGCGNVMQCNVMYCKIM